MSHLAQAAPYKGAKTGKVPWEHCGNAAQQQQKDTLDFDLSCTSATVHHTTHFHLGVMLPPEVLRRPLSFKIGAVGRTGPEAAVRVSNAVI